MFLQKMAILFAASGLVACGSSNQNSSALQADAESAVVRRAAFDLGSGSFKMKIADVSKSLQVSHLPSSTKKAPMKGSDDIKANANSFSETYQLAAIAELKTMIKLAKEAGATEFPAIAAGVYRDAKNAGAFLARVEKETGLKVQIISPKAESILGYYGGAAASQISKDKLLVWDIGGQTMQLSYLKDDGNIEFYSGKTASVSFKNTLIDKILGKDPLTTVSPNPLPFAKMNDAVDLSRVSANNVSEAIKTKIKDPNTVVVGIGGVLSLSVAKQMSSATNSFDVVGLEKLLQKRLTDSWTDDELKANLKTAFPETDISNIILVLGHMTELGITKLRTFDVDNTEGLLVAPKSLLTK